MDSLVIKHTSSAPTGSSQQFPMEIGSLAGTAAVSAESGILNVLEKLVTKVEALASGPVLAAVGNQQQQYAGRQGGQFAQKGGGKAPGGKSGGKGDRNCFKCGRPGHLARDCVASVPVWKQGKGAGAATVNGGNPNAKQLCHNYAKTGRCKFSPNCRFKHVYGTVGCLSGLAQHAFSTGRAMPASAIAEEMLTWDEEADGYCLGKDHEIDACCRMASQGEILEAADIAEMKAFFIEGSVEVPGFTGPLK